jgi:hypothetical protein
MPILNDEKQIAELLEITKMLKEFVSRTSHTAQIIIGYDYLTVEIFNGRQNYYFYNTRTAKEGDLLRYVRQQTARMEEVAHSSIEG